MESRSSAPRGAARTPRWLRAVVAVAMLIGVPTVVAPPAVAPAHAQVDGHGNADFTCRKYLAEITCLPRPGLSQYRFRVPDDIVPGSAVRIVARGQAGGSVDGVAGGRGAEVHAGFALPAGTELVARIFTGGGATSSGRGSGGGRTVVFVGRDPVVIAAGGGGAGHVVSSREHVSASGAGGDAGLVPAGGGSLPGAAGGGGQPLGGLIAAEGGPGGTPAPSLAPTAAAAGGRLRSDVLATLKLCTRFDGASGQVGNPYTDHPNGARSNARTYAQGLFLTATAGVTIQPGAGGAGWVGGGAGGYSGLAACLFGDFIGGAGGGGGGSSYVDKSALAPGSTVTSRHVNSSAGLMITYETTIAGPIATIDPVVPTHRQHFVVVMLVRFDRHVNDFELDDLTLTRDGRVVPWTLSGHPAASLHEEGPTLWVLELEAPLTRPEGEYELLLGPATVVDDDGEPNAHHASMTFWVDRTAPGMTFDPYPPGSALPRPALGVTFSEPMAGEPVFELWHDGEPVSLDSSELSLPVGDGESWSLPLPAAMTTANGEYTFRVHTDGMTDLAGNAVAGGPIHEQSWRKTDRLTSGVGVPHGTDHPILFTSSPPDTLPVFFNRTAPVEGFDLDDVDVDYFGGPGSFESLTWGDGVALRHVGDGDYALEGIATRFDRGDGLYTISVGPDGSGITDEVGVPLTSSQAYTVELDTTAPTASFDPVIPATRSEPLESIEVTFSEWVTGVEIDDFALSHHGGGASLESATVVSITPLRYRIDFAGSTDADGPWSLGVRTSGITDRAGNPLERVTSATWSGDVAPSARFDPVTTPRPSGLGELVVRFNEPVTGVDLGDFRLLRAGSQSLTELSDVTLEGSGQVYTIRGLEPYTSRPNSSTSFFNYEVHLRTDSGIVSVADPAQTLRGSATSAASVSFVVLTAPRASIDEVSPTPRNTQPDVTVRFTEPVTGVTPDDFDLWVDGADQGPLFAGAATVSADESGTVYTLSELGPLFGDREYRLVLTDRDDTIVDQFGRPLDAAAPEASASWELDTTPPVVDVSSPASGQLIYRGDTTPVVYTCHDGGGSGIAECIGFIDGGTRLSFPDLLPTDVPVAGGTLTVVATDRAGNSTAVAVDYDVIDDAIVAVDDDGYATTMGTTLFSTPGVLVNDVSPRAMPLTAELVDAPSLGTVTLEPDGDFFYRPTPGAQGVDTFTYRASTGEQASEPATVTVTIGHRPPSTPPETSSDGAWLTAVPAAGAPGDVVRLEGGGFPADNAIEVFLYPGPVRIAATTTDAAGNLSTTADIPTGSAIGDHIIAAFAGTTVATSTLGVIDPTPRVDIDSPVDGTVVFAGDELRAEYACLGVESPGLDPAHELEGCDAHLDGGTAVDDGALLDTATPGVHTLSVSARTRSGYTADATTSYTVRDGRIAAADDAYTTIANTELRVEADDGVLANDVHADDEELVAGILVEPALGTVSDWVPAQGSFTYTPNPDVVGVDTFTYEVEDGDGSDRATATVTITITADPNATTTTSTSTTTTTPTTTTTSTTTTSTTTTSTSTTSTSTTSTTTVPLPSSTTTTSTEPPEPVGPVAVGLVKSAVQFDDLDGNGLDAGDTLEYWFTITNTGAATIEQLDLRDPLVGGPVDCPDGPLPAGQQRVCAALYTLTDSDLGGTLRNTATVTATADDGATATAGDAIDTPIPPACQTAATAEPSTTTTTTTTTAPNEPALAEPPSATTTTTTTTAVAPTTTAAAPTTTTITTDPPTTTDTTTTESPATTTTESPATTTTEAPTTTATTDEVVPTETNPDEPSGPLGFRAPRQVAIDPCAIPPTTTTTPTTTTNPTTTTTTDPPASNPTTTAPTTTTIPTTTPTTPPAPPTTAPPTTPPTTSPATPPTTGPSDTTDPPSVIVAHSDIGPGQQQTATGTGFRAGDVVTATQRSTPLDLGAQVVGADGTVTFTWMIRADETPGTHTIEITNGDVTATASFTVSVGNPGGGSSTGTGTGASGGQPDGDGGQPAGDGGQPAGDDGPSGRLPATR